MKIEIQITGLAPAAVTIANAIENLASAMSGGMTPTNITPIVSSTGQGLGESATTAGDKKEAPATEELTPAQKAKVELSKEIIARGGTPPESGAVKKFQEVLDALKNTTVDVENTPDPEPESAAEAQEPAPGADETPAEVTPTVTLEEVRMLAGYMVKNQEDFDGKSSSMGKTKLGACLKKVGAGSVTDLFENHPDKVNDFVSFLENNAGKTLAEAVAETTAD